ncbi:MAG: C25 family peptidase propeptide domain-containing protein, partial [Paludibacteraceae bacterium]|nr:C25 family peptidase propeptide domain-containing protein [Paludibacteraceae bacterium]
MKKILLGLCIFIFSASLAQSRYLSFNDGYVSQRNFNTPQRTITNGDSYIDVEYKFDGAYIKQTSIDSINAYLQIYMDNAYYIAGSMAIKRPIHEHLPYYKDLIALTEDANANTIKLEIIDEKYQDYSCPLYKVNKSEVANENIFVSIPNDESKSFFPKDIVLNATKGTFRTVPVTSVNVYPVVYESSSKTLRCYSYIKYRINFNKLDKPAQLSKLALDMLGRATSNPEMLKKYDNNMLKSEDSSK